MKTLLLSLLLTFSSSAFAEIFYCKLEVEKQGINYVFSDAPMATVTLGNYECFGALLQDSGDILVRLKEFNGRLATSRNGFVDMPFLDSEGYMRFASCECKYQ